MFTRYLYTRPQRNSKRFEDPTMELDGVTIEETPLGSGKSYLAKVTGEDPNLTGQLNSCSEFNRRKQTDSQALIRCNENINHEEGEEFTMESREILDNRPLIIYT